MFAGALALVQRPPLWNALGHEVRVVSKVRAARIFGPLK